MLTLDRIDVALLDALQDDCSVANNELARRVGLSPSACLMRTRKLRENGFIRRFVAVVDESAVGLGITAFAFVSLAHHDRDVAASFVSRIQDAQQVMECWHVTGPADYLLKIVSPDIASYRDFLMDVLIPIPGVDHVETRMALGAEKRSLRVPLVKVGDSAGSKKGPASGQP